MDDILAWRDLSDSKAAEQQFKNTMDTKENLPYIFQVSQ